MRKIALSLAIAALSQAAPALASPVIVDSTNLAAENFLLETVDPSGNFASNSASVGFVTGPAGSLGAGSLNFRTGLNHGDEGAEIRYYGLSGQTLSSITTLGYSTYAAASNSQQLPYMVIFLSNTTDGSNFIHFEPLTGSETVTLNTWQDWNVLSGTVTTSNGLTESYADFRSANGAATLGASPSGATFVLESGRASTSDNFDTNVDGLTINNMVFDFEVAAPELDPNSVAAPLALTIGALLLASDRRRRA